MPTTVRELVRGLTGGAGFLIAWLMLDMPWWLAGSLAAGLYAATSFLLPAAPRRPEPVSVAPGITAQERDEFVAKCRTSAAVLTEIAATLAAGPFRSRIEALGQTTARLGDYFERKPASILAALSLPLNLDHLLKMLRQYVELSDRRSFPAGSTVAEALQKVEEAVGNATLAFEGISRQLLDNDVAALQASAVSLEYLLGVQPELERTHRQQEADRSTHLNQPAVEPGSLRRRQTEKPI